MENESLAMEKTEYLMPKINDSMSDLRTCFEILEQVESVSVVDKVSRRVHKAMVDAAMAFDFLQRRENIKYRLQFLNSYLIPDMQIGYLTTILMSLPQYLILVLVFGSFLAWFEQSNSKSHSLFLFTLDNQDFCFSFSFFFCNWLNLKVES